MTPTTTLSEINSKLDYLLGAVLSNKPTLSIDEAAHYTGLKQSYLYKLTSTQQIPHYKPRGKMLVFDRTELDAWMRQNPVSTTRQIDARAANHLAGLN